MRWLGSACHVVSFALLTAVCACGESNKPSHSDEPGGSAGDESSAASTNGGDQGGAAGTSGGGAKNDTSTSAGSSSGGDSTGDNGGGSGTGGTKATGGNSATGGNTAAGGGNAKGGSSGKGGAAAGGTGNTATGGSSGGTGGSSGGGTGKLGSAVMEGEGSSAERYATGEVSRDGVPYILITNGWGPKFESHSVSWKGTSFTVESMSGTKGSKGEPASYPSLFCGKYSVKEVPSCGLPAGMTSITTLRTGWRWAANGNSGEYNAAYDIWIGDGSRLQGYLMVWLRKPPKNTPAGSLNTSNKGITVANVPGTWDIWNGTVNGLPITNYVRPEESTEIEYDIMDVIKDAKTRNLMVPGTSVNAVAVGFEIWEGPITNLETVDFYVEVN
jgi:hypothetical protein